MTSAIPMSYQADTVKTSAVLGRPGTALSVLIHGAALLALWDSSGRTVAVTPPVVELIRLEKIAEQQLIVPVPKKTAQLLTPPAPVTPTVPLPKTVASSAEKAETYTPPAPALHAEPIGPTTPSTPAAAAAPSPAAAAVASAAKQISTEGIPTDYVSKIYARINSNTDYPRQAKMRHQQGKVGYRLTLNPAGALISFDIESSGIDSLDDAAREAIQRAAPFPRLPDLGGSSYLLAGNIIFKIN